MASEDFLAWASVVTALALTFSRLLVFIRVLSSSSRTLDWDRLRADLVEHMDADTVSFEVAGYRRQSAVRTLNLGDGRTVEVRSSMGQWVPSLADEDAWIAAGGSETFTEWCEARR